MKRTILFTLTVLSILSATACGDMYSGIIKNRGITLFEPPVLKDIAISGSDSQSITLEKPELSRTGLPAPDMLAYIGLASTISVSGSTVVNSIRGPIDIASGGYIFEGLAPNTTYQIIVVAQNIMGYSVKQITQVTGIRAPVLNDLVISGNDANSISLERPSFQVTGNPLPSVMAFIGVNGSISISGTEVSNCSQGPVDVSSSGCTFTGLSANYTYKIIVVAQNIAGNSVKEITRKTSPSDINSLGSSPGNACVALVWDESSVFDLHHVEITWSPGGNAVQTVPAGQNYYLATGLMNDTTYTFTLKAADSIGQLSEGVTISDTPIMPAGFLYVGNSGSNDISGFVIDNATGALRAIIRSPWNTGTGPTSLSSDPGGRFLYATNYTSNTISGYSIHPSAGLLTPITGSPWTAGSSPASSAVDRTGKYLYVTNRNGNNISGYSINSTTGSIAQLSGSPYADPNGSRCPYGIVAHPSKNFIYVMNRQSIDAKNGDISSFNVDVNGNLNVVAGSPVQIGECDGSRASSAEIAIDPLGRYIYAGRWQSSSGSSFSINATTGALTFINFMDSGGPFMAGTYSFCTHPTGNYVYVGFEQGHYLNGYAPAADGQLIKVTDTYTTADYDPKVPSIDPGGKFLYVSNRASCNVLGYSINIADGSLSTLPGSPWPVRNGPNSIIIVAPR